VALLRLRDVGLFEFDQPPFETIAAQVVGLRARKPDSGWKAGEPAMIELKAKGAEQAGVGIVELLAGDSRYQDWIYFPAGAERILQFNPTIPERRGDWVMRSGRFTESIDLPDR
jgi:hypothetical protein